MYKYRSHRAGQLPREHLSFLQNLLSQKYLKQEADDDFAFAWMNIAPVAIL